MGFFLMVFVFLSDLLQNNTKGKPVPGGKSQCYYADYFLNYQDLKKYCGIENKLHLTNAFRFIE